MIKDLVNNGVIYKGYKNKYLDAKGKRKAQLKGGDDDCDCDRTGGYGEICDNILDPVIIVASSNSNHVPMRYMFFYSFPSRTPSYTPSNSFPPTWGYGGGSTTSSSLNLIDITPPKPDKIDKIDATELTGKAECVYGKMVDNNNNINWILKNFKDGDKPSQFDLKFQMSTTLSNLTNASTSKSGKTFIIKINANTLSDRTSLGLARTIIHEGIHARLREFLHRKGGTLSKEDFPGVYEYYRTKDKNWDHQQMADYYRGTIAKGLKQYDNGQHSDQFYNDMAWEGLANIVDANGIQDEIYTKAWKKLTTIEKNRIKNTIADEKENGNKTCQ